MRRILYLHPHAELSGGEHSLLALWERLDRRRFQPVLLGPAAGPLVDRARALGVETAAADFPRFRALPTARGLRALVDLLARARTLTRRGWPRDRGAQRRRSRAARVRDGRRRASRALGGAARGGGRRHRRELHALEAARGLPAGRRAAASHGGRARVHGMRRRKYWHPTLGFSYGLSNLQAAVGVPQLERFEALLCRKDAVAERYAKALAGVPGVSFMPSRPGTRPVCWLYSILVEPRTFGVTRDGLMRHLAGRGIETRPFFPPLHLMPPYRQAARFPVAERLAARGLSLPSGPSIRDDDIDRVSAAVVTIARGARGRRA